MTSARAVWKAREPVTIEYDAFNFLSAAGGAGRLEGKSQNTNNPTYGSVEKVGTDSGPRHGFVDQVAFCKRRKEMTK